MMIEPPHDNDENDDDNDNDVCVKNKSLSVITNYQYKYYHLLNIRIDTKLCPQWRMKGTCVRG